MKIKNLDGEILSWSLTGHIVNKNNDRNARSTLHLQTRKLLTEHYPTLTILEEVPIYLNKKTVAYLDFYLPLLKMAIEVQGEQHFKFVPFFHGTIQGFIKAKKLDNDKKAWCDLNNIALITLNYNENLQEWEHKLP